MREPLSWKPKLLAFREAQQLSHLESMKRDLLLAKVNLYEVCKSNISPIKPHFIEAAPFSPDWSFFIAGAIQYRRSFSPDVRGRLREDEFMHLLSGEEKILHAKMIGVASKHVAHSVNEQELDSVGLLTAVDSKGKLHRGGISQHGMISSAFSIADLKSIAQLIDKLVKSVLDEKIEKLKNEVMEIVGRMTDKQIFELPDAFPPSMNEINLTARRNWPKLES